MLTKIWRFLKKDPLRRGVALAFAIFLYLHLNSQLTTEKRLVRVRVPVTLLLESGLQQPAGTVPEIGISLRGKAGVEFHAGNVQANVTVNHSNRQSDGSYMVKITGADIKIMDKNFRLHSIDSPAGGMLKLALLRRGERNAAVRPVFDGTVPPGMELSCEIIPEKVLITGAEDVISKLQYVHTARIPLADAPEFFEFDTQLALPAQVSASPNRVLARVKLIRQFSRRSMRLPVAIMTDPRQRMESSLVTGAPGGVELILRGPAAKLAALTPEQVRLFVDAVGINSPGRKRLPIRCHINAPEIEMVSIVPDEVEIQLITNTSK